MLDYRLVEALAAVIDEGGFERAAARLLVTQSAVSQRVRQLEDEVGRVLVLRESPPRPTEAGERLLRHWRQVADLEAEALGALGPERAGAHPQVRLAANPDSLAVWLMDALLPFARKTGAALEIIAQEQESTLELLKSGAVSGCVSPKRATVQGCVATRIGAMRYLLVASPEFAAARFPRGLDRESAAAAPVLHSDREDRMQLRALESLLGEGLAPPPAHYVPSTEQYLQAILYGLGYGLVAEVQASRLVARGRLVELDEAARTEIVLYWHRWRRHSALLDELSAAILEEGGRILGSPPEAGRPRARRGGRERS